MYEILENSSTRPHNAYETQSISLLDLALYSQYITHMYMYSSVFINGTTLRGHIDRGLYILLHLCCCLQLDEKPKAKSVVKTFCASTSSHGISHMQNSPGMNYRLVICVWILSWT